MSNISKWIRRNQKRKKNKTNQKENKKMKMVTNILCHMSTYSLDMKILIYIFLLWKLEKSHILMALFDATSITVHKVPFNVVVVVAN